MSLGNSAESDLLLLLFNNTAWANIGDAAGLQPSAAAGSFYIALATATLTDASTQSTSEAAYSPYARVAVARSGAGWTISGTSPTQAANTSAATFPACTSGSETETDFSFGRASSGAGEVLWYGALTAPLAVSAGITPSGAAGAFVATID